MSENNELEYFNAEWYLKQYPEVANANVDPLGHFLEYGWKHGYNPGKDFNMQEYLNQNPELLTLNISLLEHLSIIASDFTTTKIIYPKEAQYFTECFKVLEKGKKLKRVVIFASILYGSIIHDYEKYFLEKLKEVSDLIIYIADSPILPNEFKKLSTLVDYAECKQHGEYDFGSYKYGLEYLKKNINIEDIDELILCNNSCFAPVFPLVDLFETMQKRKVDFWGILSHENPIFHIQSYFLSFNNKVLTSKTFLDFLQNVQKENSRGKVILKYELSLTKYLEKQGFICDVLIQGLSNEEILEKGFMATNLTTYPCYLLEKHDPFIKISTLINPATNYNGIKQTFLEMDKYNTELATLARKYRTKFTLNQNKWIEICQASIIKKEELTLLRRTLYEQMKEYKDAHPELFEN